MKYILILLTLLPSLFGDATDKAEDRINVKGPLKFSDLNFDLAWSARPSDAYYIQEYVPAGESVENFHQMLTIHLFNVGIDPRDAVQQKVQELERRKTTDVVCNYAVTESPDGKEFIVDFLLSESKAEKIVAEFNVYRYKQVDLGPGKKGILVYAFSKRSYGDQVTDFLKSLKTARSAYLNQMISAEMPVVSIKGN